MVEEEIVVEMEMDMGIGMVKVEEKIVVEMEMGAEIRRDEMWVRVLCRFARQYSTYQISYFTSKERAERGHNWRVTVWAPRYIPRATHQPLNLC